METIEKKEIEQKNEISCDENNHELSDKKIFPIHSNCTVCSSGLIDIIHTLRKTMTLHELSAFLKKEHNADISKDALFNHFKRYQKDLETSVNVKLYETYKQEVNVIADHQRKVLFLTDVSFKHILQRLENGTMLFGLDDFGKLVNLYHSVIKNPQNATDENIIDIYKRASEKYGCSLNQSALPIEAPKTLL